MLPNSTITHIYFYLVFSCPSPSTSCSSSLYHSIHLSVASMPHHFEFPCPSKWSRNSPSANTTSPACSFIALTYYLLGYSPHGDSVEENPGHPWRGYTFTRGWGWCRKEQWIERKAVSQKSGKHSSEELKRIEDRWRKVKDWNDGGSSYSVMI